MRTATVLVSIAAAMAASACGSASTTRNPAPTAAGRIQGSVAAGPTCAVEQAGRPCQPQAVRGQVSARGADGSTQTVALSRNGSYQMTLPAGVYVLSVQTGALLPRCPSLTITVEAATTEKANISCDTGIR
jgi:hypothetical protein